LGNWAGRACFHLQPIAGHMRRHLAGADRLFMDETTAPVLDPRRGQTKKGFFWAIASDGRGHGGPSPPVVLFRFAPGRGGAHAERFLQGFRGRFLQCDGYDGYERLTGVEWPEGPWTLVHCWSRYGLAHLPGLIRYLEDGRLEMDTNPVENVIRPVALTRVPPLRRSSKPPEEEARARSDLGEGRDPGARV
jgi:hypothetical protein